MPTVKRSKPPISPATGADIVAFIEFLAVKNRKAAEIIQALRQNPKYAERPDFPSERKVQRIVREFRPRDPSGPWRFNDSDTERSSTRFLLSVAAAVVEHTDARIRGITNAEAAWLEDIYAAAPEIHPWIAFEMAREYMRREAQGKTTEDLDDLLAFAPWRATEETAVEGSWRRYAKALDSGVPSAPSYILWHWLATSIGKLRLASGDEFRHDWMPSGPLTRKSLEELIKHYEEFAAVNEAHKRTIEAAARTNEEDS